MYQKLTGLCRKRCVKWDLKMEVRLPVGNARSLLEIIVMTIETVTAIVVTNETRIRTGKETANATRTESVVVKTMKEAVEVLVIIVTTTTMSEGRPETMTRTRSGIESIDLRSIIVMEIGKRERGIRKGKRKRKVTERKKKTKETAGIWMTRRGLSKGREVGLLGETRGIERIEVNVLITRFVRRFLFHAQCS